ncbi:hypothetical protein [Actinoplanes sp. NPDC026623]|uniref:hypothetical protein n=1 Tax=Actinoplanes sp. NPDC026623 TaxID=3155610 RepID=UPI0033D1C42F
MRRLGTLVTACMVAVGVMLTMASVAGAAPAPQVAWAVARAASVNAAEYPEPPYMDFNASPEPVRKGGKVTLKARASDGWEGSAPVRIRFYFRPAGSSHFGYKGSAQSRCRAYCESSDIAVFDARKTFVQRKTGTWKATAKVRYWREDGWHTKIVRAYDTVKVRS